MEDGVCSEVDDHDFPAVPTNESLRSVPSNGDAFHIGAPGVGVELGEGAG